MKLMLVIWTMFISLHTASSAIAEENKYVFRKVSCGMTKKEVNKSEKAKPIYEDEGLLVYKDNVLGFDSDVMYRFRNESLRGGGYVFNVNHATANLYIDDFSKIHYSMNYKYGKSEIQYDWKDLLFKDHPNEYGLAVLTGALKLKAEWTTKNGYITLILHGDNYKAALRSYYICNDAIKNENINESEKL